jgi:hypothetical protein
MRISEILVRLHLEFPRPTRCHVEVQINSLEFTVVILESAYLRSE